MKAISNAIAIICAALSFSGLSPAEAATLETYVLDVAGQSSFFTYRPPQPVLEFFGGLGVFLPSNGLPVGGLSGVERLTTASSGELTDAAAASGSGNSAFGLWSASGSSSANATYGRVGAAGSGTRVNIGDGNTVVGFEGFGKFSDSLNVTGPTLPAGSPGSIVYHWTIDGSLSVTSNASVAFVAANYQQTGSPNFTLMGANLQLGSASFDPASGPGRAGFSVTPTSISGSGVFSTFPLEFTVGTPFDLEFGLFASAGPRAGSSNNAFSSTALLTGISVFDQSGQPVSNFSITSDSGVLYDASGAQIIPEPSTMALTAVTVAVLPAWRWLRRKSSLRG